MLEVRGWFKTAEVDIWAEGCQLEGGYNASGTEVWTAEWPEQLLENLMEFVGTDDKDAVELNSCDEDGRVDISVMETSEGYPAEEGDIEKWKAGEMKLYYSVYTFMVEKVERSDYVFEV